MEKKKISGLALLTIMLAMSMISSVGATEWIEVTRFSDHSDGSVRTQSFTCNYVEWRIRWEYVGSEYTIFNIYTYSQGEDDLFIDFITNSADVEAVETILTMNWTSEPIGYNLEATVEGYIINHGNVSVDNIIINLMFNTLTSQFIAYPVYDNWTKNIIINSLAPNETLQINETYFHPNNVQRTSITGFNYNVKYLTGETSGISYIHDQEGTFYMDISAANIENYTIIVEEDVDSIPEFTPVTLAIVLIAVSILAVVLSKKFKKRMKREVDEVYQELLQMLKTPSS